MHHYLTVGAHSYWTMGWPVHDTVIINRDEVADSTIRFLDDPANEWTADDRLAVEQWVAGTVPAGPPAPTCGSCGKAEGFEVAWSEVPVFTCLACGATANGNVP